MSRNERPRRSRRTQRSRRTWTYAVHLPVRYRLEGERRWRAGVTSHLSASQAVIQSGPQPRRGTSLTMIVSIPSSSGCGCVVGHGSIRNSTPVAGGRASRVVVDVTRYRLERLDRALDEHTLPHEEPVLARSA